MKTIDTKEILIKDRLALRVADLEKWPEYINRLKAYLEENEFDSQLNLILVSFQTRQYNLLTPDFEKCCDMAAPAIEQLESMSKWGEIELDILCTFIGFTKCYKKSLELAQEAFEVLSDLEQEGNSFAWKIKAAFSLNLTLRLLRARYIDINPGEQGNELAEIKKAFKHHLKLARDKCTEKKHFAIRTVLDIRQALFDGDYNAICKGLVQLKKEKELVWLKRSQDEVMDYLFHFREYLTTEQLSVLIGLRIRTRRQELKLSIDDLADALEIERNNVIKLENGIGGAGTQRMFKIARILDVGISYFYGDPNKNSYPMETDVYARKMAMIMQKMDDLDKEYIIDQAQSFMAYKSRTG